MPLDPSRLGARCDICPLSRYRDENPPVVGTGPATSQIAVVGEAPGVNEVERGVPFIGASGGMLEGYLSEVGIRRSNVRIDNALACFPPGGDLKAWLAKSKSGWTSVEKKKTRQRQKVKERQRLAGKKLSPHEVAAIIAAENLTAAEYPHPVDCCRPRLLNFLGIPVCSLCEKRQLGEDRCKCEKPAWKTNSQGAVAAPLDFSHTYATHRPPLIIVPMGNFALTALYGIDGIGKWRGSRLLIRG